ncbi:MAG TPA: serine/threonine-protein kinase [Polyangiaceae bacterium LLY-WYZ-15_(1-7)]|nr:serine/threonine-protein kinase [Polyangiaceae bacterium LLY-WYZ-15_(1-7)]HJL13082.1 serine/threonine-protein kinase [Polyangiaceae bacterium LLY-WYZ-15_(1-7)]HJL26906.1 serine/threonine-protein kinase [Polyangiaceae bacterium LLY-WYZ-15_(1-7)]HJL27999.1 serine/threonine-protein kinase [Polyangiaceae bacterium LLY-WYZ-15_(1-7)]HJL48630.1 serine/threonine-protein kinase [Polyangiaceae bacterium LLY-WYZ-15_(1-7)]
MLEGGIGAYRVLRTLGRGGLCDVVLATREPGTLRAIKVLSSHHVAEGRLNPMMEWEARVLRAVCDPHVVPLLDLVPPDRFPAGGGTPALVLRHVPGVTLSELLGSLRRSGRRLHPALAVALASRVLRGLHGVHRTLIDGRSLVHRDVTPRNVMVGPRGRVTLIDLGLARPSGPGFPWVGSTYMGTPRFAAPEQLLGHEVDPRSDLHGLGAMLWEMLTGRPLIPPLGLPAVYSTVVRGEHPRAKELVPEIPAALDAIVSALLSPRSLRPVSAALVHAQLQEALPEARRVTSVQLGRLTAHHRDAADPHTAAWLGLRRAS